MLRQHHGDIKMDATGSPDAEPFVPHQSSRAPEAPQRPSHSAPQKVVQRAPTKVRSRMLGDVPNGYLSGGYTGALAVACLAFLAIWGINGLSTAWGSRPVFYFVFSRLNDVMGLSIPTAMGALWAYGGVAHISISLIERHLWRSQSRLFYILSVPANFWDMLTAAFAMKLFFSGSLVGGSFWDNVLYTVMGYFLSLAEIPLMIAAGKLYQDVKSRR